MKRNIALLLLAVCVSAASLVGCQNKTTAKPDNTDKTESTDTPNTGTIAENDPQSSENAEPSEQVSGVEEAIGCAEAYLETVNAYHDEYQNAENTTYGLIDVDGRGVKELVITMPGMMSVYTYANGNVYTLMDGLGFGVGGVNGYDYIPGGNVIRCFNNDFAGAVCYENYYHIDEKYRLEPLYDQDLYITLFDDKNANQAPDDDEPIDENTKHLYYGGSELSEADYASMQISGEYQPLAGTMSFDELKKALTE